MKHHPRFVTPTGADHVTGIAEHDHDRECIPPLTPTDDPANDRWGSSSSRDPRGIYHRHQDGTLHRHFSAGATIGGQVIPDNDGREEHRHSTIGYFSGRNPDPTNTSGPVVAVYERSTDA